MKKKEMNPECRKVEENLVDLVEGNIPEFRQREIQKHLESCPQCGRLADRFDRLWQEFSKRDLVSPSASFWENLFCSIQADERPYFWGLFISGMKHSFRPAAIIFLLLLGLFFGYYLGDIPGGSEKAISEEVFIDQYVQDFQDFPQGSVSDFYLKYEIQVKDQTS